MTRPHRILTAVLLTAFALLLARPQTAHAGDEKVLPADVQSGIAQGAEDTAATVETLLERIDAALEEMEEGDTKQAMQEAKKQAEITHGKLTALIKIAGSGRLTAATLKEARHEIDEAAKTLQALLEAAVKLIRTLIKTLTGIAKAILEEFVSIVEQTKKAFTRQGPLNVPGTTRFNTATDPNDKITVRIDPEMGYSTEQIEIEITSGISGFFDVYLDYTPDPCDDPNNVDITVIDMNLSAPSVEIAPGLYTGSNQQKLDIDYESTGKGNIVTGEVTLVLHSLITNNLFPESDPILVTSDITGAYDQGTGRLIIDSVAADFANKSSITTTPLSLADDDYAAVPLDFDFEFGGDLYDTAYVGSNGYLTFDAGDNDPTPNVAAFLSGSPRIAACWTDLDPTAAGSVSYVKDANHLVVYYRNVPSKIGNCEDSNLQISLFNDGTFIITHRRIDANAPALSGYSFGAGKTTGSETPTDLSEQVLYSMKPEDVAIYEFFVDDPIDIPMLYSCKPACCPGADLNFDRTVDLLDLAIMSSQWLDKSSP